MTYQRSELGDFSSVVCLKAIITGMEDILGVKATAISLTSAGRIRGKTVIQQLEGHEDMPVDQLAAHLNHVIGLDGTRLCIVDSIKPDGEALVVHTRETVCSAGEEDGSDRACTYTLGVLWGAIEESLGKKYRGTHVESVLRGASHDVFRLEPR